MSKLLRIFSVSLFCVLGILISGIQADGTQSNFSLQSYIPKLEKNLKQNIIPFWMSKSLDKINGGYTINFDINGGPKDPGIKMIVTQARQVWLFSRLVREGYGSKETLDAAELGYKFLVDKMWDKKNGGFYWQVDPTGAKKLETRKHMYGQAFALYAISEYYLASGKKEVLKFATDFFNLLEARSHDKTYGGYIEAFNEDWTIPATNEFSYMGCPSNLKLMNTHLHLMEALTTFYRASKLPLARERLIELINIEANAVVRKDFAVCTDKYDQNWNPRLEGDYGTVSYGHDIENVWLLMDACDAVGIPTYPFLDLFRTQWEYALKFGYDNDKGGFFYSGDINQPAKNKNKEWWTQAETLVSALRMYRMTKDPRYLTIFKQTYDFIEKNQVDWDKGEWFATIKPDGKPSGDKAQAWKAGYHNGRSMIECLKLLKEFK